MTTAMREKAEGDQRLVGHHTSSRRPSQCCLNTWRVILLRIVIKGNDQGARSLQKKVSYWSLKSTQALRAQS